MVQTASKVIQRCILITADPGDLVLDPTCGSGTTPYVAEQWGRRWVTIDTSRVPLALARQRLLTATFPWYELKDEGGGPVGGFVYKRKQKHQVELLGLDVFDPVTMDTRHAKGDDVPAWFLDTDYNGLCFHVSQAFFPRTSAWDSLKKALKEEYEESVCDHLAGTKSEPFEAGENRQAAVKVIDDRGNELMVIEKLD